MFKQVLQHLDKSKTLGLAILLLIILALEIAGTVYIPFWRETFFNILNLKQQDLWAGALFQFFSLMLMLGSIQGVKVWVGQLFGVEWRKGFANLWTSLTKDKVPTNATQPYSESLKLATEQYIQVAVEIIISASIIVMLIYNNLDNTFIMVSSAIYTALILAVTTFFNKPLINADKDRQQADGELRELIAQDTPKSGVFVKFLNNIAVYYKYIRINMYFTLFGRLKGAMATIIPYIFLADQYFSGGLTLGQFMAQTATFELIVINTTILVIMYPTLTSARASWKILQDYYNRLKS